VIKALVQNWLRIPNQQTTATSDMLTGEFTRRRLGNSRNTYCHRSYSSKEAGPGRGRQQQGESRARMHTQRERAMVTTPFRPAADVMSL
jgi:hypothetical protein